MKKLLFYTGILLLCLAFVPAMVSAQDTLAEIEITGNENIPDEEIRARISSQPGDEYDRDVLTQDMEAVYEMGYFEDVSVSFQSTAEGLKAIFEVREFPRLTEIDLRGLDDVYQEEEIKEILGVSEGEVLNAERLNIGVRDLQNRFQDDGYILGRIEDVDITTEGVLSVDINIGYLNDVILEGNEKTRDYVIMRELEIEPGDPLNYNQLQRNLESVFRLEFFEDIYPDLFMVSEEDNTANLVLEFLEGNTGSINFGAGYQQNPEGSNWFGFLDLEERNLFGRAQEISLYGRLGGEREYRLSFYEPRVFGSELSFDIEGADFIQRGDRFREFTTAFGYPLFGDWRGNVRLSHRNNLDQDILTRSITFRGRQDTRDSPFFPQSGGIDELTLEFGGYLVGGDEDFIKYGAETRRFTEGYQEDHAVGFRLRTGFSDAELPQQEKYAIGGPDTLRGHDRMIGDHMLLSNFEYRVQVIDNVQAVGFLDIGHVWDHEPDEDSPEKIFRTFNFSRSQGLGVRVDTPIGQVRLDYAFDEDWSGTPHFGFGQTF